MRLQFCRLAFGAAGSNAQIDLGNAQTMARAFIEDEKTKLAWNLPAALLPKNRVKLLLNMLIIAEQTIPRGGTITVDAIGEGEAWASASPHPAPMPASRRPCRRCSRALENGSVDAHAIQPFYAGLLARACGLTLDLKAEGDAIVVATR